MTKEEFVQIQTNPKFNAAVKKLLEYDLSQRTCSNFAVKLFDLLYACDGQNLSRMFLAFPEECKAVINWRSGFLTTKISLALEKSDGR